MMRVVCTVAFLVVVVSAAFAFVAPPTNDFSRVISVLRRVKSHDKEKMPVVDTADTPPQTIIEAFVKDGSITTNELNIKCVQELQNFSSSLVKQAMEEYLKQKQKRKYRGGPMIQYPSSYVLAIARNLKQQERNGVEKTNIFSTSGAKSIPQAEVVHESSSFENNGSKGLATDEDVGACDETELKKETSFNREQAVDAAQLTKPVSLGRTPRSSRTGSNNDGDTPIPWNPVFEEHHDQEQGIDAPPVTESDGSNSWEETDLVTRQITDRISLSYRRTRSRTRSASPLPKAQEPPIVKQPSLLETKQEISLETAKRCVSNLHKLEQPISTLAGVGPKTAEAFARLNLYTVRSLLWHFPTSFIDRTKTCNNVAMAQDGDIVTLVVKVESMYSTGKVFVVKCRDRTNHVLEIVYFCGSSRRAAAGYRQLFGRVGNERIVSGKLQESSGGRKAMQIIQPDWVKPVTEAKSVQRIEPVYRLTQGLTQARMVKAIDQALELGKETLECIPEMLSVSTLESLRWPTLSRALVLAHHPETETDFKGGPTSPPRIRLAFEELCMQQAHLALARWRYKTPFCDHKLHPTENASPSWTKSSLVSLAVSLLPFSLTEAQKRCLEEAWNDSVSNTRGRMARLLQGDVSSGKTVVAYLLALGCLEASGGVAAILAPTTILANQHARSLSEFVQTLNQHLESATDGHNNLPKLHVELLTGGVTGTQREDILERLEHCSPNEAYLLVGTHALLTESVANRLGSLTVGDEKVGLSLAVVDEEQRFGVAQRGVLSRCAAHTLYMTATPIPRTLALGGYTNMAPQFIRTGSLDVSILDSKPKGVKPVKTSIVRMEKADQVIQGVIQHLSVGAKVFWILPRIGIEETATQNVVEQSEPDAEPEALSVVERYNSLSKILGPDRVGMVHGRMTALEREEQLTAFADPSLGVDVMVGTTVLEVGIDIASVTILVVEGAERFGLSQLHQLRGRIGRAVKKNDNHNEEADSERGLECHCVLLTKELSTDSIKRLNVLRETSDGYRVAMADFDLRGPGEMVGLQQAGLKNGFAVDLSHHYDLVHPAAILGRSFVEKDMLKMMSRMTAESGVNGERNSMLKCLVANNNVAGSNQVAAGTLGGFRIRASLAFFGNWKTSFDENNVLSALFSVRQLAAINAVDTSKDNEIERLFDSLSKKLGKSDGPVEQSDLVAPSIVPFTEETESPPLAETKPCSKPPALEEARPTDTLLPEIVREGSYEQFPVPVNNVNIKEDADTVFLVIDTETTGLSSSSYVIQAAAKVLGSTDPNERFSAYCRPPIHLDPTIEDLTGIADEFLHYGGVDSATGETVEGPAPPFSQVYKAFCDFCNKIRGNKEICILAHNAPFDVRMLNAEVKRLAATARAEGKTGADVPLFSRDTGIVAAIDTLQLLRSRELWRCTPKPSSFNLDSVYHHIFKTPMTLAHNAYGDVLGLERIVLSKELKGWEDIGKKIKTQLSIPSSVTSNLLND